MAKLAELAQGLRDYGYTQPTCGNINDVAQLMVLVAEDVTSAMTNGHLEGYAQRSKEQVVMDAQLVLRAVFDGLLKL